MIFLVQWDVGKGGNSPLYLGGKCKTHEAIKLYGVREDFESEKKAVAFVNCHRRLIGVMFVEACLLTFIQGQSIFPSI